MSPTPDRPSGESLTVAGLFAGIGGIELGLSRAGHRTQVLCEIDPGASTILGRWFPDVPLTPNVCNIRTLPRVQVVAGGLRLPGPEPGRAHRWHPRNAVGLAVTRAKAPYYQVPTRSARSCAEA